MVNTTFEYSLGQLDDMKDFHLLKSELYSDRERNALIVKTIKDTLGTRKGIAFCEYVEHAKFLRDELTEAGIKTFFIIGEVDGADRERVRKEMTEYR
jgi:superfamily II DNA/RNA helicase